METILDLSRRKPEEEMMLLCIGISFTHTLTGARYSESRIMMLVHMHCTALQKIHNRAFVRFVVGK